MSHCHFFRIFTLITTLITNFTTGINKFDLKKINIVTSAFSLKKSKIHINRIYCTILNQTFTLTPIFLQDFIRYKY